MRLPFSFGLFLVFVFVLCCGMAVERKSHKDDFSHVSQASLDQAFRLFNSGWFAGDLPDNTKIILGDIPADIPDYQTVMGLTEWDTKNKRFVIYISRYWNPAGSTADMTLLHELCHVQTFEQEDEDHGPKWEQCMVNIAEHGGFEGLW